LGRRGQYHRLALAQPRSQKRVRESLRRLDATILLLDPTVELAAIQP
jgi:hypothetical protein